MLPADWAAQVRAHDQQLGNRGVRVVFVGTGSPAMATAATKNSPPSTRAPGISGPDSKRSAN
jgi:hypothetical protein